MAEVGEQVVHVESRQAALLIAMSVVGLGIGYSSSIFAARVLGPEQFQDYAVVIAAMAFLCAVAEAGVGKYALKALPAYTASEQWSLASGYCRFGIRTVIGISLLLLEVLPVPETEVACFAAAMETGCLILLLAKSTDKLFQPELSLLLAQRSWDAGERLRRTRIRLVGSGCGLFMLVIILFGKSILGLYGPQYLPGYPALCFISFGTCVATTFSLAPAFLRFSGGHQFVIGTTIGGAVSMTILTIGLGHHFGASGAGAAFGITMAAVALLFYFAANRHAAFLTANNSTDLI